MHIEKLQCKDGVAIMKLRSRGFSQRVSAIVRFILLSNVVIRSCDQTSRNSGCPDWHRADPVNACQQAIRCPLCSVCRPCKGCVAATSAPPAETLVGRCLLLLLSSPFLLV